jgi:hypothetical protein
MGRATARVSVAADRSHRLWEKRTGAYEDAVRELLECRKRREALTSRGDVGNIGSYPREELLMAENPETIRVRSLLRSYASQTVWSACERADEANCAFWVRLGWLQSGHLAGPEHADTPKVPSYDDALAGM